jgi:hypothetical protein
MTKKTMPSAVILSVPGFSNTVQVKNNKQENHALSRHSQRAGL